jgi:HlyD family secretion protein
MKRLAVAAVLVLAAGAVAAGYFATASRGGGPGFRTAKVDRGVVVATVSASGNLNAVTTVQVGSQVSGQIRELRVDFNSPVKKGQLIARIDPEIFQAKANAATAEVDSARAAVLNQRANVEKVRAEVESAQAAVATADANVERMTAEVENARAVITTAQANIARETATVANARRELTRRIDLLRGELISQSEKDQAQTAFDTAQAQLEAMRAQARAGEASLRSAEAQLVATRSQVRASQAQVASAQAALRVAEAQLRAAEAVVRQKQAALDQARADLEHTEIRAPVNGVVVSRSIDVGQTVAASLQAPTLFTIAEDLTRMQVEAAVDEADVGRLREGMEATFTVDAFPGRTFRGQIVQIRKAPQVVQNVVSYTTVVAVSNPDGILMPGMTANVRIQVDRQEEAIRIPNAALRFRPPGEPGGEPARAATGAPAREGGGQRRAAGGAADAGRDAGGERAGGRGGGAGGGGLREVRERIQRDLGLSPEQRQRVDTIFDESRQRSQALRAQGLDDRARDAERRRIQGETRERIRELLTPEQRKKYEAMVAAQGEPGRGATAGYPARVFVVGPDGKPKAVPIFVGLTDGTYSQVLQGELQPGQEVIVGQTATPPRGGTGSPRLRL